MIFVAGTCAECGRYWEFPRQDQEAGCYLTVGKDGQLDIKILCNNTVTCHEPAA